MQSLENLILPSGGRVWDAVYPFFGATLKNQYVAISNLDVAAIGLIPGSSPLVSG